MAAQPSSSRGWLVTYTALSINLVLGVLYAWGVMKKALVTQWHWDNTQAVAPSTASTIAFSLMMIFAGRMQDKLGPKLICILGGLMLGAGLISSSFATTPTMMVLTFGIIGGLGIGLGYSATTPPCLKWFPPAKKGLIAGIVVSGIGLAAVVWAPVTQKLLELTSIPKTFVILGVITIVVVSVLSRFLVNPPAGYVPAGVAAPAPGSGKPAAARRDINWPEMLRSGAFWKLWVIMILSASAGLMLIFHSASIAKEQAGLENGFMLVMLIAIFNTMGRLVGGFFSDKIGRNSTMILFFSLQALNMFAFPFYTTPALLIFGVAFTGICYGSIFPLFPAATADFYGIRNLGVNYGFVFTAFGVAGTVGPILAAQIVDKTKSYNAAYIVCAVMLLGAVALAFTLKPPKAEAAQAQPAPSESERATAKV